MTAKERDALFEIHCSTFFNKLKDIGKRKKFHIDKRKQNKNFQTRGINSIPKA